MSFLRLCGSFVIRKDEVYHGALLEIPMHFLASVYIVKIFTFYGFCVYIHTLNMLPLQAVYVCHPVYVRNFD